MKAVELPFVESARQDGVVYLLFPEFDEEAYQGVQYEIYPEKGLVHVVGYEQGFEESGDAQGVSYPVAIPDEDAAAVSSCRRLRVIDPESHDASDFEDDEEYRRIRERYERFKQRNRTD